MGDNGMKGAIFDLDGVIVDTAKYHYLAWKWLANQLDIEFTEKDNERLKGISRTRSLDILLEIGGLRLSEEEKRAYAEQKNARYMEYISQLTESSLLPGVQEYILRLRDQGIRIALGSASKNAVFILERLGVNDLFDIVVDGNRVSKVKPDPEVFLLACRELGLRAEECVVFEDAVAGIEAAHAAGMKVIGIGDKETLSGANQVVGNFDELINHHRT
jgi:beta-phosphoglucomutase